MATGLVNIQALLPKGDRQASRNDLHQVLAWATKALTPPKSNKNKHPKQVNTGFLDEQVWQTANTAMAHASLLESTLVRKFGASIIAGATAALVHYAENEKPLGAPLAHAMSSSLGRIVRSLRFVPKLTEALALVVATSNCTPAADNALVAMSLNCLLASFATTQPRKVFDALVCEETMLALVQWQQQQQTSDNAETQAGLAAELVRSLSKQVLAASLFDRDILGSYSDACKRAATLLAGGKEEVSETSVMKPEAEQTSKSNKRARKDKKNAGKQGEKNGKVHHHFLSQLFTVLETLSRGDDADASKSVAALGAFPALISECHRCLVATAASAEVNPVSGSAVGIGKRKRHSSTMSVDTLLWLELLLVGQPAILNTTSAAKVQAVVLLLHTGHQLGIYSAATHRVALSTWFGTVFGQWEQNAQTSKHVSLDVLDAQVLLMQQLVDIDHNIVEPYLTRVFVFAYMHHVLKNTSAMTDVDAVLDPSQEDVAPASRFTAHIFDHYAKLRKLSLAITCLTSAAATEAGVSANMCTELFPTGNDGLAKPSFERSLRESLRQLPSGQIAEAWDCFHASLVGAAAALAVTASSTDAGKSNEWLMCLITSLFVVFVDGLQVTQFNSALLKQRCQAVADQVARPVLCDHVVGAAKQNAQALVLLTSASDLIVALTNLARLCEAWTFDAMPTNVYAALGRKGGMTGQQANDNPLLPIDHAYVDDLLSPAFDITSNDPTALLSVDAFFAVVSDLIARGDDSAAAAVARRSTTQLAMSCMRSLHMVHFRPFKLLGDQAPHASAGVEQTRKLIVFVLAQSRAASVDGDLVLNLMLSGVNLEVVGQLAAPIQVESLLRALVEHTCMALTSRGRVPGEPWTNSAFYEIPAFRDGLSHIFQCVLGDMASRILSSGAGSVDHLSPTFVDALRGLIETQQDSMDDDAAVHCLSLIEDALTNIGEYGDGPQSTKKKKSKKKLNKKESFSMSLQDYVTAIDLISALPSRYLPSAAAPSLLTLAVALVLCGGDSHDECVRSALRLVAKLTLEFPTLVRSNINAESLLHLLKADRHSSVQAKEELVVAYCNTTPASSTAAEQAVNDSSKSNDVVTASVARALLQMANMNSGDVTWLKLINGLYRMLNSSCTAARSLSRLCDDILLFPAFDEIEPTNEMFGVLAGVLRCGVGGNPKHPALLALTAGEQDQASDDNSLFGRVVGNLEMFTLKAKLLLEGEDTLGTNELDMVVAWVGAMCSGVHVLGLDGNQLDTLINLATICVARGHSAAPPCVRDFVFHASVTQAERLQESVLACLPVGYAWAPRVLDDSFNAALVSAGEVLIHTPRSQHQQLATFVRQLLPRLTSICRSAEYIQQKATAGTQACSVPASCRPWALLVAALSHKTAWGGKESTRRRLRSSVVGELLDACVGMLSGLERAEDATVARNTELAIADVAAVIGALVNNFEAASSACAAAIVLAVLHLKDVAVCLSNDDVSLRGVPVGTTALSAVVRVFESLSNNKRVYRHHVVHIVAGLVNTFETPGVHLSADRYVQDMANFTLDLCTPRELQQLHVGLSHAGQGTFRNLFANFQQQHKFKGKT